MSQIEVINQEINTELANEKVVKALLATTFKGLDQVKMKQALVEGRIRGFSFQDFLEKNVYAVPFSGGYSLITSIDYARKVGMRSGVVGKSEPTFEEDGNGAIISCAVTVKRKVQEYVGEYTAKVYFKEYSTGKNLWVNKPRTMISKVAEMHALRMACPEEMAQVYVEEEIQQSKPQVIEAKARPASDKGRVVQLLKELKADTSSKAKTLESIKTLTQLDGTDEKNIPEIITRLEAVIAERHENA